MITFSICFFLEPDLISLFKNLVRRRPLLLTEPTRTMAYCDIPKSASQTWRDTFCRMNNIKFSNSSRSDCHEMLYSKHSLRPTSIDELTQLNDLNIVKFMFVRHPLERLASAYNNKFVTPMDKSCVIREKDTDVPIYDAYINHMRHYQKRHMNMNSSNACLANYSNEFQFSCFVEYVLVATENVATLPNTSKDIHWWPYTEICSVCNVHYDFIGHLEDFQDDLQLLLDKFPDNNALMELYEQKKKIHCRTNCDGTDKDVYLKYFHQITKATILRLYHRYKNDFELGGYEFPSKYIAVGMEDT